jgi:hypothetical protein
VEAERFEVSKGVILMTLEGKGWQMSDSLGRTTLQLRRQVQQMAQSYRQAQILLTCVELGVFEVLAGRSAAAIEVAQATGADLRGMELLLNAATAFGLLVKQDGLFTNTDLANTCLSPDGASPLAYRLKIESAFYYRWGRLTEAVRTGKRPKENLLDEQPAGWVRTFIYGLYDMARLIAPAIAEVLALPENRPLRVLDVGGGHGGYSIALAQKHPLLTATVFELPRVVPIAREIIENVELSTRITVQEGDFQKEGLGSGYDIALVFGVLNGEPSDGRPVLIRKVFAALNPGGLIVLRDSVLEPDRTGPPDAAIFALQMLLATESGGLDTSADWDAWLLSAGFTPAKRLFLPEWIGSSLTIAVKPTA